MGLNLDNSNHRDRRDEYSVVVNQKFKKVGVILKIQLFSRLLTLQVSTATDAITSRYWLVVSTSSVLYLLIFTNAKYVSLTINVLRYA